LIEGKPASTGAKEAHWRVSKAIETGGNVHSYVADLCSTFNAPQWSLAP
jgi:hypothetical protein